MFDFLQNLTKSAEEKRQERVTAYLDEALSDRERQRFEQEMAQDVALRTHVEQLLLIKQSLRRLPQRQVPRNFMLDPAAYGRPARQPWVQAYPVLRTATALAAFFFVFAIAASIFTNPGGGGFMANAPAEDVAQVLETRTDFFGLDADEAADESAASDAAVEEPMSEEMAEEESALDEAVESIEAEAEEALEEAAEQSAEEPLPSAVSTAAASLPGDSTEEATAEDGDNAIPTPQETREDQATPTVSTLPRVTPPTPLPERSTELAQETGDAADTALDAPELDDDTESAETTAVLPEETVSETRVEQPVNTLFWLQIGLGLLLLLLVGLTFYARRQR